MATRLKMVKTANSEPPNANPGGDPVEFLTLPVVLTADLPTASASMDGRIILEDGGTGDRNIIIYAGGQRFRIDGGANV